MMCKCIIVDDEPPAIKVLEKYIKTIPNLELYATCVNAFEVMDCLKSKRIDLLFLDIQMPQVMGTELLRSLPQPPKVVFTTAHKDFAIEAFDLNAVDYLLKPISFERFLKAVNKVLHTNYALNELSNNTVSFVYFRADRKMIKIFLDDILYIESYRDYVHIHLRQSKILKVKMTLNHVEKMLPDNQFLRIHRSFFVSMSKITAFTKTDVEIGKTELPIGKSYTGVFHKIIPDNLDFPNGVSER